MSGLMSVYTEVNQDCQLSLHTEGKITYFAFLYIGNYLNLHFKSKLICKIFFFFTRLTTSPIGNAMRCANDELAGDEVS